MKIELLKRACALPVLFLAPSCLSSLVPDTPAPTRWLSLTSEQSSPGTSQSGVTTPEPKEASIRIGAVTASDSITDELISRISEVELSYDNFSRWAEPPAVMVKRALEDELFQRQGFVFASGAERRLDVEVIAFEQHLEPRRLGHVAMVARLVDGEGQALFNRRFSASLPVEGDDPALVAVALNEGMRRVVREIGELMALK